MKARLVPFIALIAFAVPVALAVPINGSAAETTYIQFGRAYWVHPNGSFSDCDNCTIRFVNDSNHSVGYTTTGPGGNSSNPNEWYVRLNTNTQYEVYLTYQTNMFAPIKLSGARPIPLVSGSCTYTHTKLPTIKPASMNGGNIFELHLYGGANEYGCPAYPQG
jgi:hypothetical protein